MSNSELYAITLFITSEVLPFVSKLLKHLQVVNKDTHLSSILSVLYSIVKYFFVIVYDVCSGNRQARADMEKEKKEMELLSKIVEAQMEKLKTTNPTAVTNDIVQVERKYSDQINQLKNVLGDIKTVLAQNNGGTKITAV